MLDEAPDNQDWPGDDLAEWEVPAVETIVRKFTHGRRLLQEELEYLIQSCQEQWWVQRRRFSSERGAAPRTFMDRVLRSHLADLERRRTAGKRGGGTAPLSLDEPVGEGLETLGELQPARTFGATADGAAISSPEDVIFEADEKPVLLRLNAVQRAIVEALKNEIPKSAIAASLQMSRAGLYREIERIKAVYRESGLLG